MTTSNPQLYCPVRGALKAKLKASDGFTFTEEKRRIECIHLLLSKGYPADRIEAETIVVQLGHKGQNSLRADVVVYDIPAVTASGMSLDDRRKHIRILAEIKRSSDSAMSAKVNQLQPALSLIPSTDVIGIYWDDVEQSTYFKEVSGASIAFKEASIASLPAFGESSTAQILRHSDLIAMGDLKAKFSHLDDILHQAGHPKDTRYEILFKILLLKIYDEQRSRANNSKMLIQDFTISDLDDDGVIGALQSGLTSALTVYGPHLPKKPSAKLGIGAETARLISKTICPINVLESSAQVLQDFFMYFGSLIYKADLAQYFTPYEVIDFVVRIVNPSFGDLVKDPACGTADFLVAAKRISDERHNADISSHLYGVDTSEVAVNLSVFNMILNGDGRSNITTGDSLQDIAKHEGKYTVALCNPPFGTKIVERRKDVLKRFDLGHEGADPSASTLTSQETGLLFVEVCLRSIQPGGRVGIILPNGYLGNRSPRYRFFREWLFKHARIAAVVGFPRFTFKRSGADVSASVVIMEKRTEVLKNLDTYADHPIHFNLVDKVGWNLQSKRAERVYKRSELDGAYVLDKGNELQLDADFERVLNELYTSTVVDAFSWIGSGVPNAKSADSWVVQAQSILSHADLSLDPKRWSNKFHAVTKAIKLKDHFSLGDILEPISRKFSKSASKDYRYIEIEQIYESFGSYVTQDYKGWALPSRAKLLAAPGDVFIANIWSSAGKWLVSGNDAADGNLLVTTGCTQFQLKSSAEDMIADLAFGLSSEAFRVQMRALCTGSDGLSSVSTDDILSIVLPRVPNANLRQGLLDRINESKAGHLALPQIVATALQAANPSLVVPKRSSHVAQV